MHAYSGKQLANIASIVNSVNTAAANIRYCSCFCHGCHGIDCCKSELHCIVMNAGVP